MTLFKGVGTAIVTPFRDGKVDYEAFGRLIDWQIKSSIDALVVCGTTGEASTLETKEHLAVVDFAVKRANGRVPVIAGAGSNSTAKSMFLAREIDDMGADGLLVVTPYYNKSTQEGLRRHYEMIADYTDLPIILYSVKSRTGLNIEPSTVLHLSKHPNIVGIKEASGNISQICHIAAITKLGRKDQGSALDSVHSSNNFDLYSGNDDQTLPILSLGGIGCISTVSNIIPMEYHNMIMDYLNGNIKAATKMQLKMKPLIDAVFAEVNPIPIKAALNFMGKIEKEYRMPLCDPTDKTLYLLYEEMKRFGIKV